MEFSTKVQNGFMCVFVILSVILQSSSVVAIDSYEMSSYCNQEISMILRDFYQTKIKLSRPTSAFDGTCEVEVESWYAYNRMMFYFDEFNLSCAEGHLEFFDGDSNNANRVKGLESPICGNNKPDGVYVTNEMELYIKLTQKTTITSTSSIIVTSFTDNCDILTDYKCDNSRCIHEEIRCTDYDSCGDESNCGLHLGIYGWIGVGVGCLVGVAIIITIVVSVFCYLRSKKQREARQQQQVNYNATHGTTFTAGGNQGLYPSQGPVMYPTTQTGYGVQQAAYTQPTAPAPALGYNKTQM